MPYLTAAVVVLAGLCLLNLLLVIGIVRRLREHAELLAKRSDAPPEFEVIAPGAVPGEFAATDLHGLAVGRDDVRGGALVGFFTPHCPACRQALPQFLATAAAHPGGRADVLAVVSGGVGADGTPEAEAGELVAELDRVARVVPEPHDGPVSAAFGVVAYPSWVRMDGSVVGASGVGADQLPRPAPA